MNRGFENVIQNRFQHISVAHRHGTRRNNHVHLIQRLFNRCNHDFFSENQPRRYSILYTLTELIITCQQT